MKFMPKIKEKRWDPKLEKGVWKQWEEDRIYQFNKKTKKPVFSIDTPPPYPSGWPWHIGAAAHYSQIDMIARTARMQGSYVFFPMGIDRNGLPVELYTEKKYKIDMREVPRKKFIEYCAVALDDLEAKFIETMKSMGMSCDFDNYYRTDSEQYRALTQATFIDLWKKGMLYQTTRPNNYCVDCGTTIADAEVEYKELPTQLVYIKFGVKETGEDIIIATTRPELICSCQAVIVNPEDDRYKYLHGKHAIIPIYNREVPIMPNPYAKPEFGTGIVMICSYGDYSDVMLFRDLGLKEIIAIDLNGRMTEETGDYAGLPIKKARSKILADLRASGLVEKVETITHRTPICYRSGTPIEIIPMDEYYLKQIEFIPQMRKMAEEMIFHPEMHRQILLNWIKSVSIDWPISRRRFYGTDIPIWYCKNCGKPSLPEPGKYYQPWKEKPPFERCKHCSSDKGFIGEDRTFDTWMDSSISPLFISKYLDEKLFTKLYPNSLRPQAKDIIRTWLYYTILRCYQMTGKSPFGHAWIGGFGVDEHGERMSKSKGNVVDPLPVIAKYGADSFRFWNAAEASLGSDFRFSVVKVEGASKFLTKLWNVARFISMFPKPKKVKLTETDKWILAELTKISDDCLKGYDDFNFFIPSVKMREFVWNLFASHYVEMAKSRAYGVKCNKAEQKSAWFTLHACLQTILKLLAPITPFITDYIWREVYSKKSIHKDHFPKFEWKTTLTALTPKLVDFNSKVWGIKKEKGISLRDSIEITVPEELKPFENDLIITHNIK